jgi:hypothetical protein
MENLNFPEKKLPELPPKVLTMEEYYTFVIQYLKYNKSADSVQENEERYLIPFSLK